MRVSLFATCLVDHLFPQVARGAERVLRRVGLDVEFLTGQTCCGQLPFNDGFWPETRRIAAYHLEVFAHSDVVIVPSGSCAAMVRHFYPTLFADDPSRLTQVKELAARTYELSEFLVRRLQMADVGATFEGRVTYLASCHGFRELRLWDEPLSLLKAVRGLEYVPLTGADECCGFGGAFSLKMAELSGAMLESKIDAVQRSGAQVVTGTDVSCLMHLEGGLRRRGLPIRTLHLAQILGGEA